MLTSSDGLAIPMQRMVQPMGHTWKHENDGDIKQRNKKKIAHMIPLWMDHPFLGLIRQDQENPPLDQSLEEDLPSDVMDGWLKTSHGNHKES